MCTLDIIFVRRWYMLHGSYIIKIIQNENVLDNKAFKGK